ncbi:MAG: hypothetical protein IPM98_00420 [Lewinellaceae bacterium]|nr:hypothetical protein [Lewinellaceae bacterium]
MQTTLRFTALLALFLVALGSCKKNEQTEIGPALDEFNAIPTNQYHASDVLQGQPFDIYGHWRVVGTSGGIHGGGYGTDFDYLLIKPNAMFGIVRNGELVTTGKIEVVNDPQFDMLVHFISDKPYEEVNIQLVYDYEKFIGMQAIPCPCTHLAVTGTTHI